MKQPGNITYTSLIHQFKTAKQQAEDFILSVEDERSFLRRPDRDTWCMAECFSHLIKHGNIYLETIRKGLSSSPAKQTKATTFEAGFFWGWIINGLEPPYNFRIKTLRPFEPASVSGLSRETVLHDFKVLQDNLIEQLGQARDKGYDLDRIRVGNPIFSFLKMSISDCFLVVGAHQRRHLWQAQKIRKRLEDDF